MGLSDENEKETVDVIVDTHGMFLDFPFSLHTGRAKDKR